MKALKPANPARSYRFALIFILLTFGAAAVHGRPDHLRIRVLAGMEPLGRITLTGIRGSGGDLNLGAAYGFSPGLEALWIFSRRIEAGAGFRWGLPRRVFRSGGAADEVFHFVPVYAALRIGLTRLEKARLYVAIRLGYTFFTPGPAFRRIPDEPLTSSSGGLYAAAALGVTFTLKNRPKWGLDISSDAGYAYHGASSSSALRSHPVQFQSMTVNLSLDWRF